jgi:hypothetical protein
VFSLVTKVGENVEKLEPSYNFVGNVKWFCHCGKTVWQFLKKLDIKLPLKTSSSAGSLLELKIGT